MRHRILVIALVATALGLSARPAAACSAGPEFSPAAVTQLLVFGRVRAVELGAPTIGSFREALVTLDVAHTYRGEGSTEITYVDHASVSVRRDQASGREVIEFAGGSGACGTIDADPVGQWVLIALAYGDDGRWHANRLYGAYYADVPDYTGYRWVLERHGVTVSYVAFGSDPVALGPVLVP